jgi:hypothetical protein
VDQGEDERRGCRLEGVHLPEEVAVWYKRQSIAACSEPGGSRKVLISSQTSKHWCHPSPQSNSLSTDRHLRPTFKHSPFACLPRLPALHGPRRTRDRL